MRHTLFRSAFSKVILGILTTSSVLANAETLPTDDSVVNGTIATIGDQNTYTFEALTGETVWLSMTDIDANPTSGNTIDPRISLYDPNDTLIVSTYDTEVARIVRSLPLNGIYTVITSDSTSNVSGNDTGPYELRFAKAPGANEKGELSNGGTVTNTLSLGDLDSYTFYGETGETVWLSMTDLNRDDPNLPGDLDPGVALYDPNGTLVQSTYDTQVARLVRTLPLNGDYTVVTYDSTANVSGNDAGPYELRFAKVPGAYENGGLVNGGTTSETISLGDLDIYTFYGETGNTVWLSMTDLNGDDPNLPGNLDPGVALYDPNGTEVHSTYGEQIGRMARVLPLNGTYTVVVYDSTANVSGNDAGPYELRFALAPGASEHGGLVNGGTVSKTLSLGDIDTYSFYGATGDNVWLSMIDLNGDDPNLPGNLDPGIALYDPTGSEVHDTYDTQVAQMTRTLPLNGRYTVVLFDSTANVSGNDAGPYRFEFTTTAQGAPPATTPRAPSGSGNARKPAVSWSPAPYATWYYVWVQDLSGTVLFRRWYSEKSTGCAGGGNICAIVLPTQIDSTMRIWIRPWNEVAGYGPWGSFLQFSTIAGTPSASAPLEPSGNIETTSATPVYEWSRVANASWYYLWIDDSTGTKIRQWVTAGQANCAKPGETCQYRSETSVRGSTRWWVRTWNADGRGPWSGRADFGSPW